MLTTTYGESVISMPILEKGEPTGPMENGMTYMVRPSMQPWKMPDHLELHLAGPAQLLVGPASIMLGGGR